MERILHQQDGTSSSPPEENGVSAIIFDRNGGTYFLILHRVEGWSGWEFPKGHVEKGESEEHALLREIHEETGMRSVRIIRKLENRRSFLDPQGITHHLSVYLVQANMNTPVHVQQAREHKTYLWATKERVLEKLTWEDEKKTFQHACNILETITT